MDERFESLESFKNSLGKCGHSQFGEVSKKWFRKKVEKIDRVLWLGVNVSDYYMLFLKELELVVSRSNVRVEIDIEKIGEGDNVFDSILEDCKYGENYNAVILFVALESVGGISCDERLKKVRNYVERIGEYYDVYVCEYVPIEKRSSANLVIKSINGDKSDKDFIDYKGFRSWQVDLLSILPIQLQIWNNLLRQNFNFIPFNYFLSYTQNEQTLLQLAGVNINFLLNF
jgi:hypothetical protein